MSDEKRVIVKERLKRDELIRIVAARCGQNKALVDTIAAALFDEIMQQALIHQKSCSIAPMGRLELKMTKWRSGGIVWRIVFRPCLAVRRSLSKMGKLPPEVQENLEKMDDHRFGS